VPPSRVLVSCCQARPVPSARQPSTTATTQQTAPIAGAGVLGLDYLGAGPDAERRLRSGAWRYPSDGRQTAQPV
jgi:hypothetical protein